MQKYDKNRESEKISYKIMRYKLIKPILSYWEYHKILFCEDFLSNQLLSIFLRSEANLFFEKSNKIR